VDLPRTHTPFYKLGAEGIAILLYINPTIEELELENNEIGDRGARALLDAIHGHNTIVWLSLEGNPVSEDLALAIQAKVSENIKRVSSALPPHGTKCYPPPSSFYPFLYSPNFSPPHSRLQQK